MDKVEHLTLRQCLRRTIWVGKHGQEWTTGGFENFKAYYLRGKHGQSGPLEGSTILRRTICEGNMDKVDKVDHLRGKLDKGSTILRRTICEGNMDKVDHLRVRQF